MMVLLGILSCKSNPQSQVGAEPAKETVLVDLKEAVTPDTLEQDFKEINLHNVKQISRPLNIVLFAFDPTKVDIKTLLDDLRKSQHVENAQSNKKTNIRD